MNRFKIILGKENEFEQVWKTRETFLDDVKGFKEFHLLKGESNEEYTLYSSLIKHSPIVIHISFYFYI